LLLIWFFWSLFVFFDPSPLQPGIQKVWSVGAWKLRQTTRQGDSSALASHRTKFNRCCYMLLHFNTCHANAMK
jgi:hypothetical protein